MLSTQIRQAQSGLFTGQTLSVDDFEPSQVAAEFSAMNSGELEHHLFDAPRSSEIVRLADKVARHTRQAVIMVEDVSGAVSLDHCTVVAEKAA